MHMLQFYIFDQIKIKNQNLKKSRIHVICLKETPNMYQETNIQIDEFTEKQKLKHSGQQ